LLSLPAGEQEQVTIITNPRATDRWRPFEVLRPFMVILK
jgi:hypothetical protein